MEMTSDLRAPGRRQFWVDLRDIPTDLRQPYLAAAEAEADAILVTEGDRTAAQRSVPTITAGNDGRLLRDGQPIGRLIEVTDADSQTEAGNAKGVVVVDATTWRVIPLENLIAARRDRPGTLFALARNQAEASLFALTLETGVDGIVLAPQTPADIHAVRGILGVPREPPVAALASTGMQRPSSTRAPLLDDPRGASSASLALSSATVTSIEDAGLGDRICIDTTSALEDGEGVLVGSTASSFVLVHAETAESEFVRARPFRVNAGALHMYLLAPDGRTRYLSELAAGFPLLVVNRAGGSRIVTVGRAKIERRPHTLVRWASPEGVGMAVLQTAETVRVVRSDALTVAVTDLKVGDKIVVNPQGAARHFGMPIDASLEER